MTWNKKLSYLASLVTILVLWWLLAVSMDNPGLPVPQAALKSLIDNFWPEIYGHFVISLYRVIVSMVLAIALSVPLGLLAGRKVSMDYFLTPFVYLLYPIPKIALLPVALVILGISDASKIIIIFFVIFNQIIITTRDAARNIPEQLVLSVASMGAGSINIYRHVVLPACLPAIFTSIRISLGSAIAVLFLSETIAGNSGLGYYILDGLFRADYGAMYAGIIAMAAMGLMLYTLLDLLEKMLCPWQRGVKH